MEILSSAFSNNDYLPQQYTCDGQDISPPLKFQDVPETARSLVIIVDDPDAPMGDFVHWTVWDINPNVDEIAEDSVPLDGIEGATDFGSSGYGGPCPPSGIHRYHFKLYALDVRLNLDSQAKKHDIESAMQGHILAEALLIGLYERNK